MRRASVAIGLLASFLIVAVAGWDFLKLDRKPPPLVAVSERADTVLIEKAARRVTLLRGDKAIKTYPLSLGSNPIGHKQQEGDRRTPEGSYAIDFKNARSRFHLALRVSYPNMQDRERASRAGVPPGGDIMIHGLPNGLGWLGGAHRSLDWTDGCAAVTNREIEEIWSLVDVGTRVEIRP